MSSVLPPGPAERLGAIIGLLCRTVAARSAGGFLGGLSVILIWTRLRRIAARVAGLAARRGVAPRHRPPRMQSERPARPAPKPRLPRGTAWLVRLVPETACGAAQLQHLLTEPDMAELIAATPQMGRLLRPLCRMLGVAPPPAIATPPRPLVPAPPSRPVAVAGLAAEASVPSETKPPPGRRAPRRPARPPICGPPVAA